MAFWQWPKYVCVAEKKALAAKKLEKLKKKREVNPVVLSGKALARTWWGKAWNENLERYADYSNRIGRGRSYVRHGAVLDLQVREGEIIALVQGSRSKPYEIIIAVKKLNKDTWSAVTASCAGMIDSLSELIEGQFPKAMAETFMQQGTGLFPSPKEINLKCSCPDWATMCKHVAAALYGVGARLDEDPSLFFTLRGVDTASLIKKTVESKAGSLLEKAKKKTSRTIEDSELSALFGIELVEGPAATSRLNGPKQVEVKATPGKGPSRKRTSSAGKVAAKKKAKKTRAVKR